MKFSQKFARQGDLVFERIDSIPVEMKQEKKAILARGEHTGHLHQLQLASSVGRDSDGTVFFELKQETELTHQEHHTIVFPPGKYKMHQEREYDYFLEGIRQVRD